MVLLYQYYSRITYPAHLCPPLHSGFRYIIFSTNYTFPPLVLMPNPIPFASCELIVFPFAASRFPAEDRCRCRNNTEIRVACTRRTGSCEGLESNSCAACGSPEQGTTRADPPVHEPSMYLGMKANMNLEAGSYVFLPVMSEARSNREPCHASNASSWPSRY